MPKQDKYTLDEAQKYAAEIGEKWTPALEQELRSAGKIIDKQVDVAGRMALSNIYRAISPSLGMIPVTRGAENPGLNAMRSFIDVGSQGYYDPMNAEEYGTSDQARIGRGVGAGGAVAAQFAVTAPVVAPLRAMALGKAIAPAAQFGLLGATRNRETPIGPDGVPVQESFGEQAAGRLKTGAEEAALGVVLSGLHLVPGVSKFAQSAVGGPILDTAVVGASNIIDRARSGQSLDPKEIALDVLPFVAGMRGGNAAAGAVAGASTPDINLRAVEIAKAKLAAQVEAQNKAQMEYPERLRAEQFRAVRAGEASPFPNPQMRWEADRVRQHNEQVLRDSVLQQEAGARNSAQREARARQLEQEQARVNEQRGAGNSRAAQQEARRQAEVAARLEGVAAGREANLAKPVEYPRDPLAGPVSPTAGERGAAATNDIPQDARAPGRRGGMGMTPIAPRRGPTLDMMGGQQLYEWMRDGIKNAGGRRAAAEERRVNDLADKMVSDTARGARIPGLEEFHGKISAPAVGSQAGATPGIMSARVQPVEGNAVTVPAAAYLNGDISLADAIKAISNPALAATSPAVNSQLGLNAKPGTPAFDNVPKPIGVGKAELWRLDRVRATRRATGGGFNNPATKESLRVGQIFELFTNKMNAELQQAALDALDRSGLKHDSPDLKVVSEFLDKAHKIDRPISISANTEGGQKILVKAQNPEATLQLAGEIAKNLEAQARFRDLTRKSQGLPPVRRRGMGMTEGGYWPHTERQYSMTGKGQTTALDKIKEIGRAWDQRTRTVDESSLDPNNETNLWSAREQSRSKEGLLTPEQINYDLLDVISQYSQDTSRMVGHTQARQHGANVAEAMRARAKALDPVDKRAAMEWERAADIIKTVADVAYGGKRIGPDKFFYQLGNMNRFSKGLMTSDAAIKQAFNSSRYASNLRFMLLTQWTSVFMAASQGKFTMPMLASAMREAGTKRIHDEWLNAYSHYAKNRKYATVGNESSPLVDRGNDLIANRRRGKAQKVSEATDFITTAPTNAIENATGRVAFALAEQLAKRAIASGEPLSPQDVAQFKSDFVGLTQSYYDRVNRAPILNAPFLNTAFPAQGFPLEALNSMGDLRRGTAGPKMSGKQSKAERAAVAGQFLAASYLMNMLVTMTTSDKESTGDKLKENVGNTATTFLPYSALYVPDVAKYMPEPVQPYFPDRYSDSGKPYQQNLAKNLVAATAKMVRGDVSGGLVDLGSNFVKAGAQIKRVFDTDRKIEEGKIPENERLIGSAWGPSATPTGKKNIRKANRTNKRKGSGKYPEPVVR